MKTIYYAAIISTCVLFGNCTKKQNAGANTTPGSNEFTISEMKHLNIATDSSGHISFDINPAPAKLEDIKFELIGLPANISYEFSNKIHESTLHSNLQLRSEYADQKVYTVTVKATNTAGISKSEDFELNISKPANCHNRMLGTFKEDNGNGSVFAKDPKNINQVIIPYPDQDISVTMNCETMTFTMYATTYPVKNVAITTQGQGSFNPPNEISYSMTTMTTYYIPEDPSKTHTTTETKKFSGKRVK